MGDGDENPPDSGSPARTLCSKSAQPPLLPASAPLGLKATVDSRLAGESPAMSRAGGAKGLALSTGAGMLAKGEAEVASRLSLEACGVGGGGGGGGGAKGRLVGGASRLASDPDGAPAALCFLAAAAASLAMSREERDAFLLSRTSQMTNPMKAANRTKNPLVSNEE